jgi:hypothetical protein
LLIGPYATYTILLIPLLRLGPDPTIPSFPESPEFPECAEISALTGFELEIPLSDGVELALALLILVLALPNSVMVLVTTVVTAPITPPLVAVWMTEVNVVTTVAVGVSDRELEFVDPWTPCDGVGVDDADEELEGEALRVWLCLFRVPPTAPPMMTPKITRATTTMMIRPFLVRYHAVLRRPLAVVVIGKSSLGIARVGGYSFVEWVTEVDLACSCSSK